MVRPPEQQKQQTLQEIHPPHQSVVTQTLLKVLRQEIALDGGACLVSSLKDYIRMPSKRLNALLVQSNVGKAKLLTFLEGHPTVFRVDRETVPHWVQLVTMPQQRQQQVPSSISIGDHDEENDACGGNSNNFLMEHIWDCQRYPINDISDSFQSNIGTNNGVGVSQHPRDGRIETFQDAVYDKAMYVLQKRKARLDRRRRTSTVNDVDSHYLQKLDPPPHPTKSEEYSNEDDNGVYMHWLLRHCCWDLHSYLRVTGFYLHHNVYSGPETVQCVGSRNWEPVVMGKFEETLRSVQTKRLSQRQLQQQQQQPLGGTTTVGTLSAMIQIQDGKAFLRHNIEGENGRYTPHSSTFLSTPLNAPVDDATNGIDKTLGNEKPSDPQLPSGEEERQKQQQYYQQGELQIVRQIDVALTNIVVHKDGGHQVSLQLILHRYPDFKRLLCGRDLWKLYQIYSREGTTQGQDDFIRESIALDAPSGTNCEQATAQSNNPTPIHFFNDVVVFQDGPNIILQSKRPKALSRPSVPGSEEDIGSDDNTSLTGRLKVDEEGLYSVTNTKWGRAFANLLAYGCQKINLFGDNEILHCDDRQKEVLDQPIQKERLVVDMTASVGGITLGLAKCHFFQRIIAMEIDPIRAGLCQENMLRHGFDKSVVAVRNTDSVAAIPSLPRGACFVLDPPWGGYNYKQIARVQQGKIDNAGQASRETHYRFLLGDTLLEDVLLKIAYHNAPCIVGMRLPINYKVPKLLDTVREKLGDTKLECITIRKVSVQLFVILYFS
jgi:hypothetical protein